MRVRKSNAEGDTVSGRNADSNRLLKPFRRSFVLLVVLAMMALAACDDGETPEVDEAGEAVDSFAMINPATIADGDYGAVGFAAVEEIEEDLGLRVGHSESVDVADAGRIAQEYIDDGFDVIGFHGGQFLPISLELAAQFPDTTFIVESSGPMEDRPDNVWNIARYYYPPFYAMGALGAMLTETGTVAYLAGLEFPDTVRSANSFYEGARSVDDDVELIHAFTGDFFDDVRARQTTSALIDQGADVIIGFNSPSTTGTVEAIEAAPHPVLFTSQYTEKLDLAPDSYVFAPIFDFGSAYKEILERIAAGERGGELDMSIQAGNIVMSSVHNVPPELEEEFEAIWNQIASGEIEVQEPSEEDVQAR